MALTLINKPIGHKLTGINLDANIYDDGTGTAIVYTGISHGLSDGDYVYIQSDIDDYNGFKYVDSISYDYFKIKNSENGDYVGYIQDAEVEYQVSILNHGFQCVHLPIVYELESDLSPVNTVEEAYQPNTVDAFSDDNGNTQIDLNYALSDPTELSKIELVGDGPLAGVYTIIEVLQPWSVVINLAYDAGNDFSGYVIVRYYDNYTINVNVYAGYPTTHRWEEVKPFELAATLKFTPDNEGRTKFSISELLRSYINNRNNLTLNTLPNNTDFSVAFYISYFESYDQSDGEDITTFEGEVTTDDFVGYALNAKLEFKTESVGHMSEYINQGSYVSKWLKLFEEPIALVGYFFDMSFINQYDGADILVTKNGESFLTITNPGSGIIRVPYTPESGETESCFVAHVATNEPISLSFAGFQNRGLDPDQWVTGLTPSFEATSFGGDNSDYLYDEITLIPNIAHNILVDIDDILVGTFTCYLRDIDFNVIDSDSVLLSGAGTVTFTVTPTDETVYLVFRLSLTTNYTLTISNLRYEITEPVPITESLCVTVLEECDSTFIPDNARLTEDGDFRILE